MNRHGFRIVLLLIISLGFSGQSLLAQEKEKGKWHYLSEIYLMFPTMNGEVGIGDYLRVELDADAGSIFSHIKMGAMLYLEATNDDWPISSDLIYMKLGQDVVPTTAISSGEVTMKQYAWELAGLKHITPWLEAGIGGRLVSLYTGVELDMVSEETRGGEASKTWFDPIIILRSQGAINGKWLLQFRGDIGGFGIGSDFAWQIQAYAGYRFCKLFQATIGYRYIGINYDKGEGVERFLYDVDTYGPVVRLGFNF